MDKLIELSKKVAVSVHVDFNPHKDFYESAENYFGNFMDQSQLEGVDLSKDIWTVQFYPHTPIGFYQLIGNDLEELLDLALKIDLEK
jgi:hypothetical protein